MTTAIDGLVWSKSQVATFKECLRKGHFTTLSKEPSQNIGEERNSQLDRLRKLKNRHLWTGSLLHETIGDLLKIVRQGEPLQPLEELIQATREKMRASYLDSKENRPGRERLFEHEYASALSPQVWKNHWETMEKSLRWFYSSKWLLRFQELGPEAWKAVDEVLNFDVDGVKTYVKIDCAVQTGDRFILIDWKSTPLKMNDDFNLQVAALYACEVWGADVSSISSYVVSLVDGRHHASPLNEDILMDTHLRIQEEANQLSEKKESFSPDPFQLPFPTNRSLCDRCNFKQVCYPSGVTNLYAG